MENWNYGHFNIELAEFLEKHNISKNKLATAAKLQRTQLISYCRNEIQRPDLGVLARICCVLNCSLDDIIKYYPPSDKPVGVAGHNHNNAGSSKEES